MEGGGDTRTRFYATPSTMTALGAFARLLDELPPSVPDLVQVVQHLVVYDAVASDFYGFAVPAARADEIHLRSAAQKISRLAALEVRPLRQPRRVERRLVGRCHHFVMLLVAMLRHQGIPARARSGFGAYFNPPFFEDHWICEVADSTDGRWRRVDVQFDEVWCSRLKIDHDVLDVPPDRFLVAADAWRRCRERPSDAQRFGIGFENLRGLWFVAASLVRDLAALNRVEMLPWDVWGAQPAPNSSLDENQLRFFDELAALTVDPDASFNRLTSRYATDEQLRVPDLVFNALRHRQEPVRYPTEERS